MAIRIKEGKRGRVVCGEVMHVRDIKCRDGGYMAWVIARSQWFQLSILHQPRNGLHFIISRGLN